MMIRKAYRYRLYPSREQEKLFAVNFGHARYVYNHFLSERQRYFAEHQGDESKRGMNYNDTAAELKALKGDPQHEWLKEAHSQVLQQSLKDLERAYENFFTKRAKHPKFHSKRGKQAIRYPQSVKVGEGWISIPKIGKVKAVIHRPCAGAIKNTTLSKTKSGRYFASIQVEIEIPEPPPPKPNAVGVDVGLKSFLVTSDGVAIPAPKYLLKAQKRLVRLQRHLSRCKKGSSGREKARKRLACQHEKVANQRSDFLHKTSRWLVDTYGLIGLEDLNVKGMVKNRKLARAISDSGWGELKRQLTYKAAWHGSLVVTINRFFPSSKRCSACSYTLPDLPLATRTWICPNCGTTHDRDFNAATNILNETITRVGSTRIYAEGESVSPTSPLAVLNELGSHPL